MSSRNPVCLLFVLGLVAAGEVGAAHRAFARVFAVQPGCTLKVDSYRGDIQIEESDFNEVRAAIEVEALAASETDAEKLLTAFQIDFEQRDNLVSIAARNPRETGLRFTWSEDTRTELVLRLSVPKRCDVEVVLGEGQVTLGNLAGRMRVRIRRGSAFLRRIEGAVDARVDVGDLMVSRCSGEVTARILKGHMRLGTMGGKTELKNATGDIEIMAVKGGLVAEAQVGDVRAGFAPGLSADSRVSVSGGSIYAEFHAKTACRIDAASTWGRVNSKLSLTPEPGGTRRSFVGQLNGGGPLITLQASGGSVHLAPGLMLIDEE